jgi:uncharacterized membrane protein YfcA
LSVRYMPGFETLTLALIAWIAIVMLGAGLVQGALGLGFPTLATPLIALVTDIRTAVILVLLPCLATVITSAARSGRFRQTLAEFWTMPVCAFAGAIVGTQLFIAFPGFPYALLLAGIILVYLNLDRLGTGESQRMRRHSRAFGVLFGFLAGVSEGTANVAAPPLIIYYLGIGLAPSTMVQAMNICFITGKATQFATLATSGGVPIVQWAATLPFAVLGSAGAWYGVRIRNRIDAVTYRRWVRGALYAIAGLLIGEYVYGWL